MQASSAVAVLMGGSHRPRTVRVYGAMQSDRFRLSLAREVRPSVPIHRHHPFTSISHSVLECPLTGTMMYHIAGL